LALQPVRFDALSLVFATAFGLVLVLGAVYALQMREWLQQSATALYAAGALGVVFAGDLVTLYVCWELMAFSSVWLIWAQRDTASWQAGWRYLLVHVAGGMLLLAGIVWHYQATGSLAFTALPSDSPGFWLILAGFGVNA